MTYTRASAGNEKLIMIRHITNFIYLLFFVFVCTLAGNYFMQAEQKAQQLPTNLFQHSDTVKIKLKNNFTMTIIRKDTTQAK